MNVKQEEIVRESSSGWGVTQYLLLALAVIAVLVIIALLVRGMQKKRAGTAGSGPCPQCEADRSAGKRFCTRCGAPLAPAPQPGDGASGEPQKGRIP